MLLLNYDLYDIYALICYIRGHTDKFPLYRGTFDKLIEYIEAPLCGNGTTTNTIRKLFRPVYEEDVRQLSWIAVDNRYTANVRIVKKAAYYSILVSMLREMILCENDTVRLYELCDAIHNIPLLLAEEHKAKQAIPKLTKNYRKKYDRDFLINETKKI